MRDMGNNQVLDGCDLHSTAHMSNIGQKLDYMYLGLF